MTPEELVKLLDDPKVAERITALLDSPQVKARLLDLLKDQDVAAQVAGLAKDPQVLRSLSDVALDPRSADRLSTLVGRMDVVQRMLDLMPLLGMAVGLALLLLAATLALGIYNTVQLRRLGGRK